MTSEIADRYRKVAGAVHPSARGRARRRVGQHRTVRGLGRARHRAAHGRVDAGAVPRRRRIEVPEGAVGRRRSGRGVGRLSDALQAALDDPEIAERSSTHGPGASRVETPSRRSASATSSCTPGTSRGPPGSTRPSTPTRCTDSSPAWSRSDEMLRQSGHYGPPRRGPPRRRRTDQAHRLHRQKRPRRSCSWDTLHVSRLRAAAHAPLDYVDSSASGHERASQRSSRSETRPAPGDESAARRAQRASARQRANGREPGIPPRSERRIR